MEVPVHHPWLEEDEEGNLQFVISCLELTSKAVEVLIRIKLTGRIYNNRRIMGNFTLLLQKLLKINERKVKGIRKLHDRTKRSIFIDFLLYFWFRNGELPQEFLTDF